MRLLLYREMEPVNANLGDKCELAFEFLEEQSLNPFSNCLTLLSLQFS